MASASAALARCQSKGGKVQFFPFLTVDQIKGHPIVAWMDARNDATNHAVEVFTTRSVNCGPPAPKNIVLTITSSSVRVNWDYSPPADLSAFNVYLVANGVYTKLGSVPASYVTVSSASSRTYNDTTATKDGPYTYVVAAVDTAGEEGPYSDPITIIVDR